MPTAAQSMRWLIWGPQRFWRWTQLVSSNCGTSDSKATHRHRFCPCKSSKKNAFLKVFCFLLPVYFNYKQVWWVGFCSSRSGDRVPLHCVDRHPNQQHIVATGGQDGMLCVWDVRQGNTPFSLMEAHTAESKVGLLWEDVLKLKFKRCFIRMSLVFLTVWEVHFHPTNPDHLFTCSEDGSLLHWETSSHSDMPSFLQGKSVLWHKYDCFYTIFQLI